MKTMIGVVTSADQEHIEPQKQVKCSSHTFVINYQGIYSRVPASKKSKDRNSNEAKCI